MSTILGQNTTQISGRVPHFNQMVKDLVKDAGLRSALTSFSTVYDDLRHFGEPKHLNVMKVTGNHFTRWMIALQQLWIEFGELPPELKSDWFENEFKVEWVSE